MGLTCECPEWDGEDDQLFYLSPDDFTVLATNKRKRCCSCKKLIDIDSTVLKFERIRYPKNDIEVKIHGSEDTEIPLSPWYMCEDCGDQYFNLSALNFCIYPGDNMFELLKEYQENYIKKFNEEGK